MKKLLLLLVALVGVFTANAVTYNTTATDNTLSSDKSTWTENGVKWSMEYTWNDATKTYYKIEADGLHIGSKSNYIKNVKMSTSDIKGTVTSVKVSSRSNSTTTKLSVTVGGKTFTCNGAASVTPTTSLTAYEFIGTGEGEIVINASNTTSGKNIYLKTVDVDYQAGDLTIGNLTASYNGAAVGESLTIDQSEAISLEAKNATSFSVTVDDAAPILLPASAGKADWIPGVCNNASVKVKALLEADGKETQESNEIAFNLTVNKVNAVIANWVVTGIPSNNSGNELNKDLICSESSAQGIWTAAHSNSYAATNDGKAQLGSSNTSYTFNGGTLTLSGSAIPENATILSVSLIGYNNVATIHAVWSISVNGITADNKITFSNSSSTHTAADVNLTGNQIVLTCASSGGNMKQTYLSGISIKYSIPEEAPGEVVLSYEHPELVSVDDINREITMEEGVTLTFTSEGAENMVIKITDDNETELPALSAEGKNTIDWTPAEGLYIIDVEATNAAGTTSYPSTFVTVEAVELTVPEFVEKADIKEIHFSCKKGLLYVKMETFNYGQTVAARAAENFDWIQAEHGDRFHKFDTSSYTEDKLLSAKAVSADGKKETAPTEVWILANGTVSGIRDVAVDAPCGEAVYFNLQGQRVDADRPGLYIRVLGGKAEKVAVR